MNVPLLRFRCLRNVRQPLGAFHILVGPNASGKTTFLDVFALLGRLVSSGLEATISERSHNLSDLFWGKSGTQFTGY
ncbi:MAG: AAA family ATPase [Pseudomonadota bacterium]